VNIVEKNVNEIIPYINNPRVNDNAVDKVAASIKAFGFKVPCVISSDNVIVTGHTRIKAAKKLGMETVPCIIADDLTDAQIKAFRLADNKVAEFAEWDFEKLEIEFEGLADFDLEDFGFEVDFDEKDKDTKIIEDKVPEEVETRCKLGDIWQLGNHKLICGDSTDVAVIDRLMDGVKADMVFCDPPYGMKKESEGVLNDNLNFDDLLNFNRQWIPLTFGALKDNGSWYCWGIDEPLMDIYSNILKPMAKENKITFRNIITWDKGNGQGQLSEDFRMYPIADEKCLFVMCGQCGFTEKHENTEWVIPIVEKIKAKAKKYGLTAKDMRVAIGHSANGADHFTSFRIFRFPQREYYEKWFDDKGYDELKREYEELRAEYEKRKAYFDNTHDNMNNVWHFDRAGKDEREHTGGHATPKPIALCSRAIKSSSREGEIVLDVFGGSGSTLIACEQLNRKCYMCELDEHYCDVIIQRWENLTGKQAMRLSDGL
jgi:DNA modification methylase